MNAADKGKYNAGNNYFALMKMQTSIVTRQKNSRRFSIL